jgi:hypothetical protein
MGLKSVGNLFDDKGGIISDEEGILIHPKHTQTPEVIPETAY